MQWHSTAQKEQNRSHLEREEFKKYYVDKDAYERTLREKSWLFKPVIKVDLPPKPKKKPDFVKELVQSVQDVRKKTRKAYRRFKNFTWRRLACRIYGMLHIFFQIFSLFLIICERFKGEPAWSAMYPLSQTREEYEAMQTDNVNTIAMLLQAIGHLEFPRCPVHHDVLDGFHQDHNLSGNRKPVRNRQMSCSNYN